MALWLLISTKNILVWDLIRGAFERAFYSGILSALLVKMLYLREVNRTLSYLRQCWGKDFGLLMGMACHKLLRYGSSIEPNVLNRTDMSTLFVLIQDQSIEKVNC